MTGDVDKLEAQRKVSKAWEELYNERNRLWRAAEDKLDAVGALLEANGCDCDCGCDGDGHEETCEPCLACRIGQVVSP